MLAVLGGMGAIISITIYTDVVGVAEQELI